MRPLKYGVAHTYYGGTSPAHADFTRALARANIGVFNIRGSAYPEMTIAEQCRQALLSDDLDVLVFHHARVHTSVYDMTTLAHVAHQSRCITGARGTQGLELAAIPLPLLREMAEHERRLYGDAEIRGALFRDEKNEILSAIPLASPFRRDGAPLDPDRYLTPDEAFLERARRIGASIELVSVFSRRTQPGVYGRSVNLDRPITDEPGTQFVLCIPSYGTLDIDQLRSVQILENSGMAILEYNGCEYIDQVRSYLTELALASGRGVFFLDHDIQFDPRDVIALCAKALERQSVIGAPYCMRRSGKILIGSFDLPPGRLGFFKRPPSDDPDHGIAGYGLEPAHYTGLGFTAVPKDLLLELAAPLPKLTTPCFDRLIRPWYALNTATGFYAGEDVSFAIRVRNHAIAHGSPFRTHEDKPTRVFLDASVRIAHRGIYDYMIEDAGMIVPCMETVILHHTPDAKEAETLLKNAYDDVPLEMRLASLDHYVEDDRERQKLLTTCANNLERLAQDLLEHGAMGLTEHEENAELVKKLRNAAEPRTFSAEALEASRALKRREPAIPPNEEGPDPQQREPEPSFHGLHVD